MRPSAERKGGDEDELLMVVVDFSGSGKGGTRDGILVVGKTGEMCWLPERGINTETEARLKTGCGFPPTLFTLLLLALFISGDKVQQQLYVEPYSFFLVQGKVVVFKLSVTAFAARVDPPF
jgi:hypothetical protein